MTHLYYLELYWVNTSSNSQAGLGSKCPEPQLFKRPRQKEHKFEASLVNLVSSLKTQSEMRDEHSSGLQYLSGIYRVLNSVANTAKPFF